MLVQYISKVNYKSLKLKLRHKLGNCRCANKNKYDNCKVADYFEPNKYSRAKGYHLLVDGKFYPMLNELIDLGEHITKENLSIDGDKLKIKLERFNATTGQCFDFNLEVREVSTIFK